MGTGNSIGQPSWGVQVSAKSIHEICLRGHVGWRHVLPSVFCWLIRGHTFWCQVRPVQDGLFLLLGQKVRQILFNTKTGIVRFVWRYLNQPVSSGYSVLRERLSTWPIFPRLLFANESAIDVVFVPWRKGTTAGRVWVLLPFTWATKRKEDRFIFWKFAVTDGNSEIPKMRD